MQLFRIRDLMMTQKNSLRDKARVGFGAGLVAGFAIFSTFFAIDQQLGLPNGTFYKTIGIPLGLEGFDAIALGFFAHMGASALIGICYSVIASQWRIFRIVTAPKGMITGAATGVVVFAIFFLPIHTYVMTPAISAEFSVVDESRLSVAELDALYSLLLETDNVLWHGLFLHVLFGTVLGLMTGFMLHEQYAKVPRIRGFW